MHQVALLADAVRLVVWAEHHNVSVLMRPAKPKEAKDSAVLTQAHAAAPRPRAVHTWTGAGSASSTRKAWRTTARGTPVGVREAEVRPPPRAGRAWAAEAAAVVAPPRVRHLARPGGGRRRPRQPSETQVFRGQVLPAAHSSARKQAAAHHVKRIPHHVAQQPLVQVKRRLRRRRLAVGQSAAALRVRLHTARLCGLHD